MKGASDEDDILSFFSSYDLYFYHTKNQLRLSPPSGFSRHLSLFWPVSLCQPWLKIILQRIWVIIFTKSANLSVLEVLPVRNYRLLLDTFCTFKSPQFFAVVFPIITLGDLNISHSKTNHQHNNNKQETYQMRGRGQRSCGTFHIFVTFLKGLLP